MEKGGNKKKIFLIISIVTVIIILLVLMGIYIFSKIMNSNYEYLDSQEIKNPLNLKILREYPKGFYAPAIQAKDLDGDNIKEIIYKSGEKIYILNNSWNRLYSCSVGSSVNDLDDLLIDDLNNDGLKEIITSGGEDSIFEGIFRNFSTSGYRGFNAQKNNEDWQGLEFFDELNLNFVNELKKYVSDLEVTDEKKIIMSKSSWDYLTSEHYGLKILDNKCNLISQDFISRYREGTDIILSKNLDEDSEKEVVIKLTFRSNNIYYLNNNQFSLTTDSQIEDWVNSEIQAERNPVSQDKIKKYYLTGTIFLEDINNDGNSEIILLARQPVSYVGVTKIFILNSSNGELIWKYTYPTWINSATVEDINNDGFKEIIVTGHYTAPITIFGLN